MMAVLYTAIAAPIVIVIGAGYGVYRLRAETHQFKEAFDEKLIVGKTLQEIMEFKGQPGFYGQHDAREIAIYYGPHGMSCTIAFDQNHRAISVYVFMR